MVQVNDYSIKLLETLVRIPSLSGYEQKIAKKGRLSLMKKKRTYKKAKERYDEKYYDEIINKNRLIYLYDLIDDGSSENVNKKLLGMYLRNKKPITIEINSPGGDCCQGLSIIDTIERIKKAGGKVYTIITGSACSMGSVISIVGSKRFMSKNAYYMMHPMVLWNNDYLPFVKDRVRFAEELYKRIIAIYRENTKLPEDIIKQAMHGEIWLTAEECLKYGVIDKIL